MARFLKNPDITRSGRLAARLPMVADSTVGDSPIDGLIRFNQNPTNSVVPRIEFYYNNQWNQVAKIGTVQLNVEDLGAGDGTSKVIFTMSQSETDPKAIAVFVGGVYQKPNDNYSVSVTNIIFTSPPPAPTGMSPNQIIVIHNLNSTNAV
jgi:hypothetical protein